MFIPSWTIPINQLLLFYWFVSLQGYKFPPVSILNIIIIIWNICCRFYFSCCYQHFLVELIYLPQFIFPHYWPFVRGIHPVTGGSTHCCLMTPYSDIDLGQHWLRKWLVAWRHQAIAWTNVDASSVRSCTHLRTLWKEALKVPISKASLNIEFLKLHPNPPGANELRDCNVARWCLDWH